MDYEEKSKSILDGAFQAFVLLLKFIRSHYTMDEVWKEVKPGNDDILHLRFLEGSRKLAAIKIRKGYFIIHIVFCKPEQKRFEAERTTFSSNICTVYDNTDISHVNDKWLYFEICDSTCVDELCRLIQIKRKPNNFVPNVQTAD